MSNEVTSSELERFERESSQVKTYTNGEITIYWEASKCIHSANCIIGLPHVFNSQKRPWINTKNASSEEMIQTVNTCPSRALLYRRNASAPLTAEPAEIREEPIAQVQILRNGPALITGRFSLVDASKTPIPVESGVAAICRCGASEKKPFCDGSHRKIGFTD